MKTLHTIVAVLVLGAGPAFAHCGHCDDKPVVDKDGCVHGQACKCKECGQACGSEACKKTTACAKDAC